MENKLGIRKWLSFLFAGFVGQIAWAIENNVLNLYVFYTSPERAVNLFIPLMTALSAVTATITSAELTGRASVDFSAQAPYMFIRNKSRGTAETLRADPGDLVLTREGEFVGVVVEVESFEMGRKKEAKVLLFDPGQPWNDVRRIPIAREPGQEFYTAFSNGVKQLKARQLEPR